MEVLLHPHLLITPATSAFAEAAVYAMIFPIVWLAFCLWLNREHPRRSGFLFISFLLGAFVVIPTLPIQSFIGGFTNNTTVLTILWAACEEVLKFCALFFILSQEKSFFNGPRDYPIVAITVGLGFAGFENALYFFHPVFAQNFTQVFSSGGMRFFGANLLHAITVSLSGLALGLAYFKSRTDKIRFAIIGIAAALFLHSVFNLLLGGGGKTQLLEAFGLLWLFALASIVFWSRLSTMEESKFVQNIWTASLGENEKIFSELIQKLHLSITSETPLRDVFISQNLTPATSIDYASFEKICAFLRTNYELHLREDGMNTADSKTASSRLISDAISPKTVQAVFALLKNKTQNYTLGQQKIEVLGSE